MTTRSMTRARVGQPNVIGGTLVNTAVATRAAQERLKMSQKLMSVERKMLKACQTVILLNDRMYNMCERYNRARRQNYKSFRYSHRIRMAVIEGVRNMYYEYARDRAEEVAEIRQKLYNQRVTIIDGSNDVNSDSDTSDSDDDEYSYEASDSEDSMEVVDNDDSEGNQQMVNQGAL